MDEFENQAVVLVIDDTAENLALISEVLRGEYKVKVAPSGTRGLQLAQSPTPPDLILLDIMMPDMDGYEVMRQLQADARTKDVPVIFLTAMSSVEDERRGLDLGAVDYITKPISPSILQSRVRNHLQLKAARDFLEYKSDFLEREVKRRTHEVTLIQEVTILALASLAGMRNNETGNHVLRIQQYVRLLAQKLARHPAFSAFLTPATIELLYKSAPLHDIGKVGIPDRILLKPSELTSEEYEVMKTYTTLGGDAIANAELAVGEDVGFLRLAKELAYNHQERWDGSGYPRGLKGEDIPISARLMAVADVYDALISRRVYKSAMAHEQAVQMIRDGRATQFDPDIVDVFLANEGLIQDIANHHKDSPKALLRQAERMLTDLGGEEIEV